jgi:AcrR family transcriptional regulator
VVQVIDSPTGLGSGPGPGGPPSRGRDLGKWQPRRVAAVAVDLPDGVTPPGTRGRILHAALALFAEFGFHGTSVRDIAARVGITAGTLYAHYPSKEDILAEAIRIGHEELHGRLQHTIAEAGSDPAARLAALVRAQVLAHADYPLLATVANNELHALSADKAGPALALRERSRHLLLQVLGEGAEAGAFAVADDGLAAIAIAGIGLRVANWFGPDQPYSREEVADAFAAFALRIVGANPPNQGATPPNREDR